MLDYVILYLVDLWDSLWRDKDRPSVRFEMPPP